MTASSGAPRCLGLTEWLARLRKQRERGPCQLQVCGTPRRVKVISRSFQGHFKVPYGSPYGGPCGVGTAGVSVESVFHTPTHIGQRSQLRAAAAMAAACRVHVRAAMAEGNSPSQACERTPPFVCLALQALTQCGPSR